ncbi:hypothetical protein BJF90_07775 [Pseudonocardia sp. CNS-004]|nr:hypothetical protein BJF90_07775 [Pseudonocardia sp. CNS-004]
MASSAAAVSSEATLGPASVLTSSEIEAQSHASTAPTASVSRRRNAVDRADAVMSSWASEAKLAVNIEPCSVDARPASRNAGRRDRSFSAS